MAWGELAAAYLLRGLGQGLQQSQEKANERKSAAQKLAQEVGANYGPEAASYVMSQSGQTAGPFDRVNGAIAGMFKKFRGDSGVKAPSLPPSERAEGFKTRGIQGQMAFEQEEKTAKAKVKEQEYESGLAMQKAVTQMLGDFASKSTNPKALTAENLEALRQAAMRTWKGETIQAGLAFPPKEEKPTAPVENKGLESFLNNLSKAKAGSLAYERLKLDDPAGYYKRYYGDMASAAQTASGFLDQTSPSHAGAKAQARSLSEAQKQITDWDQTLEGTKITKVGNFPKVLEEYINDLDNNQALSESDRVNVKAYLKAKMAAHPVLKTVTNLNKLLKLKDEK